MGSGIIQILDPPTPDTAATTDGDLQPYRGEAVERQRHLGRAHVRRGFGADGEGGRTYRFNRLGFRGPDPDPTAEQRVYVFGESHAFGYFVELEESWPWRFVDAWCAHQGLDRSRVETLCFADPGASNAAIARMVVSQCSARRPDLVLVHFADIRRSEVLLDGRPHRIGPWLLEDTTLESARNAPGNLPATLSELIERGRAYFRHSLGREDDWMAPVPDLTCQLEFLRELLLVQSYCRAEGIRLLATCDRMEDLRAMAPQDHPTLAPLVAALDETTLAPFGIWSMEGDDDRDAGHADPSRHVRFAQAMFDFYLAGGKGAG